MIMAFIAITFQEESPKFYYGVGKFDKAREVLTRIGRKNGLLSNYQTYQKVFKKEIDR
jgi:hypothetical protein